MKSDSEDNSGSEEEQKEGKKKKRKREERMDAILGLLAKAIIPLKQDKGSSGQAMANLQISWLKNLQAYNPKRDDLAVWCSRVRELLPPGTSSEDALRLLMTRLPHNLSDTLRSCVNHVRESGGSSHGGVVSTCLSLG